MIFPTESDLGRRVVYSPPHGKAEEGVITSLSTSKLPCVFVRFRGPTGELTRCCYLEWAAPR